MWRVNTYTEEYASNNPALPACLLLSGWGFDTAIFEWLLPGLAQHFRVYTADCDTYPELHEVDVWLQALLDQLPEPAWLMGWSLGGNIAIELAVKSPEQVLGLLLMATTPKFISNDEWLVGVSQENFAAFERGIEKNVDRTLARFDAMQVSGDALATTLHHALKQYRLMQQPLASAELLKGLCFLQSIDQTEKIRAIQAPMMWCFGELDPLINAYAAYEVKRISPLVDTYVFRQAAHALFLSQPDKVFKALLAKLNKNNVIHEKQRVAASFSRAASHYEQFADLQKQVAVELSESVEYLPGILMDVGCGTGYMLEHLQKKADHLIGFDMAHGMLDFGKKHYPLMQNAVEGDLEDLPFLEHSIAQIYSSLAVQWSMNIDQMLEEWHRVLRPGGKVYIATLGENTLFELRKSWQQVDGHDHVNHFVSAEDYCEAVYQSPFVLKSMNVVNKVIAYRDARTLMRELKNIGAQTVLGNEPVGLMGKGRFLQFEQAYEQYRNAQGILPATYEVIYLTLEKHQ